MASIAEAQAFLTAYAERSQRATDEVLEGRVVATCSCDYEGCEGWQLINEEHLLPWRQEEVFIRG